MKILHIPVEEEKNTQSPQNQIQHTKQKVLSTTNIKPCSNQSAKAALTIKKSYINEKFQWDTLWNFP